MLCPGGMDMDNGGMRPTTIWLWAVVLLLVVAVIAVLVALILMNQQPIS